MAAARNPTDADAAAARTRRISLFEGMEYVSAALVQTFPVAANHEYSPLIDFIISKNPGDGGASTKAFLYL
jgi:hypothetical protein